MSIFSGEVGGRARQDDVYTSRRRLATCFIISSSSGVDERGDRRDFQPPARRARARLPSRRASIWIIESMCAVRGGARAVDRTVSVR